MPVVYGLFVPNAPNLIAPELFGGAGASTVASLRALRMVEAHRLDAVIVATPHWYAPGAFLVQGSRSPRQIYDFSGFPPELSEIRFEPPGHPELARRLVEGAARRGVSARLTEEWGLDHGAWAPLMHLVPGGRVPVVPISISSASAAEHSRWGEAISAAVGPTGPRVAVVGTGSILHRLDRFARGTAGPWAEGAAAEQEVVELALRGDVRGLAHLDRRKWALLAPEGELAPLFITLGGVGPDPSSRLVSTDQVFGAAGLSILEFVPA